MNMIQKMLYAGAASVALFAVAPASAATSIAASSVTFNGMTGFYGATIQGAGEFAAPFLFEVPTAGKAGISVTSISLSTATAIQNLVVSLNGTSYPITAVAPTSPGIPFVYKFGGFSQNVAKGIQNLVVTGTTTVDSSFSGTIGFTAAVPEPASWALMIGGFGLVGGAMRRRAKATNVNVAFA
jgi:hypothetical protein